MAKVTIREWYRRVELLWAPHLPLPALTPLEAIRAARKLYRFVTNRPFPVRNVRLTQGNRSTAIRHGIMFVNPQGAARDSHKGWEALVHDLSHYLSQLPHGGKHARFEMRMVKEVIKRGWLNGELRDTPKVEKPKPDAKALKYARTLRSIERWEAKQRRAANALKKLNRSLRAQERAMKSRGVEINVTVH